MRILSGKWSGTPLASPSGRVRPTSEEVRDVWMRELGPDLEGARLLELYAGSGALGLEALSRGAASCDFVENNPSALHALKANVVKTRASPKTRIFKRDALHFLDGIEVGRYDLVIADPPYQSRQLDRLVERWLDSPFSRILSVEHATDHALPGRGHRIRMGETTVTIFE